MYQNISAFDIHVFKLISCVVLIKKILNFEYSKFLNELIFSRFYFLAFQSGNPKTEQAHLIVQDLSDFFRKTTMCT